MSLDLYSPHATLSFSVNAPLEGYRELITRPHGVYLDWGIEQEKKGNNMFDGPRLKGVLASWAKEHSRFNLGHWGYLLDLEKFRLRDLGDYFEDLS